MGKDVVTFLSWAAEPEMEERKLVCLSLRGLSVSRHKLSFKSDPVITAVLVIYALGTFVKSVGGWGRTYNKPYVKECYEYRIVIKNFGNIQWVYAYNNVNRCHDYCKRYGCDISLNLRLILCMHHIDILSQLHNILDNSSLVWKTVFPTQLIVVDR